MKKASAAVWAVWIILTILIAAGLVYYYQFTKLPQLNEQISNLQDQVKNLQEQVNNQSNSNNETADWETYTNKKYGYTIKYPANYSVNSESSDSDENVTVRNSDKFWVFNITVEKNSNNLSLTQVASQKTFTTNDNVKATTSESDIKIGGISAKKVQALNQGIHGDTVVIIIKDGNIITISGDDSDEFTNFLSTFQFTD